MSDFPSGMTEDDFIEYWNSESSPWIGDALSIDDVIDDIKTAIRILANYKQELAAAQSLLREAVTAWHQMDVLDGTMWIRTTLGWQSRAAAAAGGEK